MHFHEFDRVVCLTCDRRPGQAERVQSLFVGKSLPVEVYRNITWELPSDWRYHPGSYYQLRAFREIVKQAKDDGVSSLLFLEDDVVLSHQIDQVLEAAEVPGDWGLIYYGYFPWWGKVTQVAQNVGRVEGVLGTWCLGIRSTVFDAILNLPENSASDNLLADHLHNFVPTYGIVAPVAFQIEVASAITGG